MDRIDKYKRVEEDQQQGKGKSKVISQERRDFRSDRYKLGNLDLRLLRWLTLCFENQCIKSWRRLRTSHTSNVQKKWEETL